MEKDTELDKTIQTPTEDITSQTEPISSELEGTDGSTKPVNAGEKQEFFFDKQGVKRNMDGTIAKGNSLNPWGKEKGTENFDTWFVRGIEKLAKVNGKEADEMLVEMSAKYAEQIRKGDFRFLKDYLDRKFGKPTESHEITGKNGGKITGIEVKIISNETTTTSNTNLSQDK